MRESGESQSETGGRRHLKLSELVRIGLFTLIGAGFLFSSAVMIQLGMTEGLICILAVLALVVTSLPLVGRARGEIIEPIWFVVLIVAVGVTGKAFYVFFGPEKRVDFLLLGKEPRDLLFAALMIVCGLLCLSIGYIFGNVTWKIPGMARLAADQWNTRRLNTVVALLLAVGLISFIVFMIRINPTFYNLSDFSSKRFIRMPGSKYLGVQGYLRWGAMLIEISFYLVYIRWVAAKGRVWSYAGLGVGALALLAVAFPIFVSSRQTVLFLVIRIIVIWTCIRGEPKPRYAALLVASGLVIVGSMLAFRRGLSDWEGLRSHVGVSGLMEVTVGGRHFLDLTKTAHVLAAVPELLDYQYGKTMVTWLVAPVPRSLWPGKPAIGVGIDLGPLVFQTPRTSGVPPGVVGELYLNFGIPGVFIGMLAVGFLLRSLYTTLRPRFPSRAVVLIYTLLSTRIALGMLPGAVSGSAAKLIQEMIPVVLVLLYMCGSRRSQSAGREP